MKLRTVEDTIAALEGVESPLLPAPAYRPKSSNEGPKFVLAVSSMSKHMTDEGYQLMTGLRDYGGYKLVGHDYPIPIVDVRRLLGYYSPRTVVVQDKREWEATTPEQFKNVGRLRERPDIFKLTVLKDAQQRPEWHRESAEEIGCHAWVTYYHPRLVKHVAPYIREEHLVRTYHSVNPKDVPSFSGRDTRVRDRGCLLSGAMEVKAYPLRRRLKEGIADLPDTDLLVHPGYGNTSRHTPEFLQTLSRYKVAICTSSKYGYTLRKLIEATACGCRVITDLPTDDPLPEIDDNLIRIPHESTAASIALTIREAIATYDPSRQEYLSQKALARYDYANTCRRLAEDIETLRRGY